MFNVKPRNPNQTFCPKCENSFPDIWAYKRHQDSCVVKPEPQEREGVNPPFSTCFVEARMT